MKTMKECLLYWEEKLNLKDITTKAILDDQVTYPKDLIIKEFVGVSIKDKTIYHTRPLTEEDIVHELLHVKFPDMSEADVNLLTDLILKEKWKQYKLTDLILKEK